MTLEEIYYNNTKLDGRKTTSVSINDKEYECSEKTVNKIIKLILNEKDNQKCLRTRVRINLNIKSNKLNIICKEALEEKNKVRRV